MLITQNVSYSGFFQLLRKLQGLSNGFLAGFEKSKYLAFVFCLLLAQGNLLAQGQQSVEIQQGDGAKAENVGYEHIGFTGAIKITYDLVNCNEDDFYYVSVYHEEAEIGYITEASERAITGANKLSPIQCGDLREVVWDFSKEPKSKRRIGNGEFVVDVFTISATENKSLHKATVKYKKKINKLDRKILKAINKGRSKRLARLEKRKQRKEARYAKRFSD